MMIKTVEEKFHGHCTMLQTIFISTCDRYMNTSYIISIGYFVIGVFNFRHVQLQQLGTFLSRIFLTHVGEQLLL